MTIQDLGALGELIGSVAVLATLIYLTVQTRQNAKALQAQAEGNTLAAQIQFGLASAASKELSEAWFDGEETQRDYRRRQHGIAVLSLAEWYFYQGEKGLVRSVQGSEFPPNTKKGRNPSQFRPHDERLTTRVQG